MVPTQRVRLHMPPVECALVSTSGALLERRQGVEIDDARHVIRIGSAPVTPSLAPFVGGRTTVRYVKQAVFLNGQTTRINHTLLHDVFLQMAAAAERSEIWYSQGSAGVCNTRGLARVHYDRGLGRLPLRCVPTKCACAPKDREIMGLTRKASSGLLGLALAFRLLPECDVVRLWGFGNENESLPYHYWRDGSELDAQSTAAQYRLAAQNHGHDFRGEHAYVHRVLGGGTWAVGRDAFEGACGRAPANYSRLHRLMRFENATHLVDGCGADGCGAGAEGRAAEAPAAPTAVPRAARRSQIRAHLRAPAAGASSSDAASDAAYVFALLGQPSHAARTATLAAISLLQATGASFPVVCMLGAAYHRDLWMRAQLAELRVAVRLVTELEGVRCQGPRRHKGLEAVGFGAFSDASYTKLAAWNLTEFRVVVYLDSDVAVVRNLDHVAREMLAAPQLHEARTLSGCQGDGGANSSGAERANFNTGVWALRPNRTTYARLLAFLRGGRFRCITGDQTAANAFFHDHHDGVAGAVRVLHAGYNLKADKGAAACLRRAGLRDADAHVVHWSGVHKPWSTARPHDAIEREQLLRFNHSRGRWAGAALRLRLHNAPSYAHHGAAFGHFVKGYVLSVVARLAERGVAHGPLRAPRLHLEVYTKGLPRSASPRLVLGFLGELFGGGGGSVAITTAPPNASAAADALPIVDVGAEPRHTGDCSYASLAARLAATRVGAAARAARPLAITILRRGAKSRHARDIGDVNALELQLRALSLRLGAAGEGDGGSAAFGVASIVPEANLTVAEQLRLFATTDVAIGMHGSGMSMALFMPPRSLVLDVMPYGYTYCLFEACVSHDEQLWVHVITKEHRARWGLSERKMLDRGHGRPLNATALAAALEGAWKGDMVTALNLTIPPAACARVSLREWFGGAVVTRRPGACGRLEGFEGIEHNSWPKHPPASYNRTTWPRCVDGVVEA